MKLTLKIDTGSGPDGAPLEATVIAPTLRKALCDALALLHRDAGQQRNAIAIAFERERRRSHAESAEIAETKTQLN